MVIVVDASVVVEIVTATGAAQRLLRRVFGANDVAHAPHLLDLEVVHALRRHWITGALAIERIDGAIDFLSALPIERHAHEHLLPRIWALRENITAYDAAYVALAESLDATLITRDAALARSSGHAARIEYIE